MHNRMFWKLSQIILAGKSKLFNTFDSTAEKGIIEITILFRHLHLSSVLVSFSFLQKLTTTGEPINCAEPANEFKLLRFYLISKVCPNSFAVT